MLKRNKNDVKYHTGRPYAHFCVIEMNIIKRKIRLWCMLYVQVLTSWGEIIDNNGNGESIQNRMKWNEMNRALGHLCAHIG